MTTQNNKKMNKKGSIYLDILLVILMGVLFAGFLLYAGLGFFSIFEEQEEFYGKYYDFQINFAKATRDSCISICNDKDLSWSSVELDTLRCFCSESDGKLIQYRLEIDDNIWNKYFPKRLG